MVQLSPVVLDVRKAAKEEEEGEGEKLRLPPLRPLQSRKVARGGRIANRFQKAVVRIADSSSKNAVSISSAHNGTLFRRLGSR